MTRKPWPKRAPAGPAGVVSRADWHKLLELATTVAGDADRGAMEGPDPELRLATLSNRINVASTAVFAKTAGAATDDAARGFVRITRAFARRETPPNLRREMAAMVLDGAAFLETQLHRMATEEFERAHRGRPEVYG